jgi:hypothetical protein
LFLLTTGTLALLGVLGILDRERRGRGEEREREREREERVEKIEGENQFN